MATFRQALPHRSGQAVSRKDGKTRPRRSAIALALLLTFLATCVASDIVASAAMAMPPSLDLPHLLGKSSSTAGQAVGLAAQPNHAGGWVAYSSGLVVAYGTASELGSFKHPAAPVVAIAAAPGGGYWLVTATGHVQGFGGAPVYADLHAVNTIVGIISSPNGQGYLLLDRAGAIYPIGNAVSYGQPSGHAGPFRAIVDTPDHNGYWVLSATGRVYAYGQAVNYGSPEKSARTHNFVSFGDTPSGHGYWETTLAGQVWNFGDARHLATHGAKDVVSIVPSKTDSGYIELTSQGTLVSFGNAHAWKQHTPHIATSLPAPPTPSSVGTSSIVTAPSSDEVTSTTTSPIPTAAPSSTSSLSPTTNLIVPSTTIVSEATAPTPLTSANVTAYVGVGNPAALNTFADSTDITPIFASDYFDMTSWAGIVDDVWDISNWKNSGFRMIWGVPMLPSSGQYSLAQGATGAYNSYFKELAENLVAAGMGNSVLRLGWEFNVSTFPWYAAGQPAAFVAYWRQIVTTMRSVPGAGFSFEWNVDLGDNGPGDAAMGSFGQYYPGATFVDIIGMDVYDMAWDTYPGAAAEFQSILARQWGLNWLVSFAAAEDKPLAIPEMGLGWGVSSPNSGPVTTTGAVCGGDDPTFINDMASWISAHNVAIVGFWDYATSSVADGQNPLSANALANDFGSPS